MCGMEKRNYMALKYRGGFIKILFCLSLDFIITKAKEKVRF